MGKEIINLDKGTLTIEPINAYQLILDFSYNVNIGIETKSGLYDKAYITGLLVNSSISYKIGDTLQVSVISTPYTFTIKQIYQLETTTFLITTDIRNKSTYYITPAIFSNKNKIGWTTYLEGRFKSWDNCNFINTYLELTPFKKVDKIVLKYLFTEDESYLNLEKNLMDNTHFIDKLDKGQYVYFRYRVPMEFKKDMDLFLDGKYSNLSTKLKINIVGFLAQGKDEYYKDKESIKANKIEKLTTPLAQGLFLHPELRAKIEEALDLSIEEDLELISKPKQELEVVLL